MFLRQSNTIYFVLHIDWLNGSTIAINKEIDIYFGLFGGKS